ncbi:hypothetical protein F4780DRAFT_722976 [Xylariomycetidae sp. FL0641]|nr:hypothetical protein F4780DRAFT_722976 [Xylariomycetidae sp. FL0641]
MFATRALRQAAAHAERTPMIKFIGKRSIPASVDHSPKPHPESPTGKLPSAWGNGGNSHTSFLSYRDSAQQHGPLRKSIGSLGATPAAKLGSPAPPKGMYWDRSDLPQRFRRTPLTVAEIEAIETGGAAMFG